MSRGNYPGVLDIEMAAAGPVKVHYTGFILSLLRRAMEFAAGKDAVSIDNAQANGAHGVYQARVRLAGDPGVYRLIVAPADAPIEIYGRAIGEAFSQPLGDG